VAAWSDVGVAAVGAAGGIVAALAGVKAQAQIAIGDRKEERADAVRRDRLERVAEVLGPIQTLLIDLLPPRALGTSLMSWDDVAVHRSNHWLPLREKWEVLLVKEPAGDVREDMRHLEVEIENLYNRLALTFQTSPTAMREDDRTWYDDAVDHHTEATRLAETIASDLHGGGGN
jgi:hypothetical protein